MTDISKEAIELLAENDFSVCQNFAKALRALSNHMYDLEGQTDALWDQLRLSHVGNRRLSALDEVLAYLATRTDIYTAVIAERDVLQARVAKFETALAANRAARSRLLNEKLSGEWRKEAEATARTDALREAADLVVNQPHPISQKRRIWDGERPYVCEEDTYRAILALIPTGEEQ